MRVSKIAGFASFVVACAAAQVEPIDGVLAQLWANICSNGATLRLANTWQSSARAMPAPQEQVVCPPQPTSYTSLPSVTARGNLAGAP